MAINTVKPYPKWLFSFNKLDSTNNYAMTAIEDGLAHHGDVIWALSQTAGKGQRGKVWESAPGENVMMTLIIQPNIGDDLNPYHLNIIVAHTISTYLIRLEEKWQVNIKWPNDIYINAKKTAGILIENTFRGSQWTYALLGIGINVNQKDFNSLLTNASSLALNSSQAFDLQEIITDIRAGILNTVQCYHPNNFPKILEEYNQRLFGKGELRRFKFTNQETFFEAKVIQADAEGMLHLETPEGILKCEHGSIVWVI